MSYAALSRSPTGLGDGYLVSGSGVFQDVLTHDLGGVESAGLQALSEVAHSEASCVYILCTLAQNFPTLILLQTDLTIHLHYALHYAT